MDSSILTTVIPPIALGIIMIGMGMTLTTADFKRILVYPKAVALGTTLQMVVLPLVGFILVILLSSPPVVAVGIILVAACPGGVASNVVAHVAKGDTALSVTLTIISSFLTVITIPLIVNLALQRFMGAESETALPILKTSIQIFLITIPTILIGMLIRYKAPAFADGSKKFTKRFSLLFLIVLSIPIFINERDNLLGWIAQAGLISAILCLSTASIGFFSGRIFGLDIRQRISITVEVGFQNSALALVIATSFLNNTGFAVSAMVYGPFMYLASLSLIAYMNLSSRWKTLEQEDIGEGVAAG